MRFKYYLRGIGIGITLATLLLTISFYFGKDKLSSVISDQEIINRATELGMVMPEDTENSLEGSEEALAEATSENSEDVAEDEDQATVVEEDTLVAESNLDSTNSEEDTTITYVPFTVRGGQSSEIVSDNLLKAGLIDSADDFNKYLSKLNLDNLIQAGTFYVKEGSTYDDIIALLVNKEVRTTTPPREE